MQKEIETRVVRIMYLLNRMDAGTINLRSEAARLNVSPRTLQRDIKVLQDAEFPIYDPKPGLYTFTAGASLERMNLSPEEASVLCVMSDVSLSLGKQFGGAFSKLKKRFCKLRQSPFFVKLEQSSDSLTAEIVKPLEDAIQDRHIVNIYYKGNRPRYCNGIKPLKMCWMDGFWYLVAMPAAENAYFKFRMDKITRVIPLDTKFACTADIDGLLLESKSIWFDMNRNIDVLLEVRGDAVAYFKKHEYFPCQKIEKENTDGSLTVSCRVSNLMEIMPQVKRWLPLVKILEPIAFAAELKAQVRAYLDDSVL